MRQLDGERQSLVYNHHHELIDATDTISAVSSSPARLSTSLTLISDEESGGIPRFRPGTSQSGIL
jgi:hypothetical protein